MAWTRPSPGESGGSAISANTVQGAFHGPLWTPQRSYMAPQGTGKTMFAEALAKSAGVPLVSASFARWQASGNGYLGDCLKAMRATFDEARRRAPCVLLIDEMDAIGNRATDKGAHDDYWTAIITGALELLDGTERLEAVLVLGTTNDPGAIDPALLRSGRMDRMLEIRRPDLPAALEGILRHHLGPDLADVDISSLARLALGRERGRLRALGQNGPTVSSSGGSARWCRRTFLQQSGRQARTSGRRQVGGRA